MYELTYMPCLDVIHNLIVVATQEAVMVVVRMSSLHVTHNLVTVATREAVRAASYKGLGLIIHPRRRA